MKKPPVPGWESTTITETINIPTPDGKSVADVVEVQVPVWRDPSTGQVYHDEESRQVLEKAKARHMGILSRSQLKELREMLNMTQKEIAELLQLGTKTWTRWETGRERPSRSSNILLCAMFDGKIDQHYLQQLQDPTERWNRQWKLPERSQRLYFVNYHVSPEHVYSHEAEAIPA